MKNLACMLMLCFALILTKEGMAQATDTTEYNFGIWQGWSKPLSITQYPEVKGRLCNLKWKDIEPQPNVFSWAAFDSEMASRASDGLPIVFAIFTKEDAPVWLYQNGVPKVIERDSLGYAIGYSPYYKDSSYKYYFKRMIDSVRQHVETLPSYVREKIIAVQTAFGSTGDYISYKGIVDLRYQLNDADFFELFKEFTTYYYTAYSNSNPLIRLLNNPNKTGKDQIDWLMKNAPGGWLKSPAMAKGFGFNNDLERIGWLYDYMNKPLNGNYFRSRSEMAGSNTQSGWWIKNIYKNMFATMAYNIHWGLDWPNQTEEYIKNAYHTPSFVFFNKYAGKKDPVKSDVAMCFLKDALDAADSIRFPASQYGEVSQYNASRYSLIQQQYTAYGALLEDVSAAMSSIDLGNLAATGTNDVGWKILRGNYDRYLHQIDANETSVGFWNIPSSDPNTIYGKFGRGFELASNKDALYFNVDDLFLNNAPVNGQYPITIDITYLDKGAGSWQLFYDGVDQSDKPSIQVYCTNSGLWKKATVTWNDAYFGNRGIKNADFYIKNSGAEDVIFSLVELSRNHKGIANFGLYALSNPSFDTICVNSTSRPSSFVIGASSLDGSPITVRPLDGYEYATDSEGVFADSLTINNYGSVFYQTIYVRFNPKLAKSYSGNIIVGGGGMNDILVAVNANSVDSRPVLQPLVSQITCFGAKNGSVDLNISGGTEPLNFNWTNGAGFKSSNTSISSLSPGSYAVNIQSYAGCAIDTSFVITEPELLGSEVSLDPMICKNGTTTLHVNGTGGTLPYTGIGNFTVGSGNQNYTITDANGCIKKGSINVPNGTMTAPSKPGAISSPAADQQSLCGGGEFEFSIDQVPNSTSYSWTLPAKSEIISANYDSSVITLRAFADFNGGNLSVAALNGCGSSVSQTKSLSLVPGNPGQITGPTAVMPSQAGVTYSVEALPGMTYEWTIPTSAAIVAGQNTNVITVNWGIFGGSISVKAKNACDKTSATARINVTIVNKTIALSATSLPDFETTCIKTLSSAQPVSISATGLDGSPVIIGPQTGFKFAASENGVFNDTYSITGYGSMLNNRTIFVKYNPQNEGVITAYVPVSGGGSQPTGFEVKGTAINTSPALSTVIDAVSCIGSKDGKIDLSVTGGTGPFTYFWTGSGLTNPNSEDIQGLSASTYKVTVTSYLGCTTTESFVVPQPDPLVVELLADPMECKNGSTIVHVTASGGVLPYNGTGDFSAPFGKSTYSVTDANGCLTSKSINVSNGTGGGPSKPGIIFGAEADAQGVCGTGIFNFSIDPVPGATSYAWTAPANSNIQSTSPDGTSIKLTVNNGFSTGNLSVVANNNCGSSLAQVKSLTALPESPAAISGPSIVTANQPGLLYSVPPVNNISYNWTLPNTGKITQNMNSSIIATWGKNAGKLKVSATNNCGVSTATLMDVSFATSATIYPSSGTLEFSDVCNGSEKVNSFILYGVLLNGSVVNISPATNYSFSTVEAGPYTSSLSLSGYGNTITQPVFVKFHPISNGKLSEKIKISGGGVSAAYINLTGNSVSSSPILTPSVVNPSCYGSADGAIQLNVNGGVGPFTFQWFSGDNMLGGGQNISNLASGSYMVKVGSAGGCNITQNFEVQQPAKLDAQIVKIDGLDKAIISASGGVMPYSGTGTFDLVEGINYFIISDAKGCSVSDSILLEKDPPLFVNADYDTIDCAGGTTEVMISAEGGVEPYSGTGSFTVPAGSHSFTVTDANGQQTSIEVHVNEPAPLDISLAYDQINCNGDSTFVTVSGIGGIAPYSGEGLYKVAAGMKEFSITDAKGCLKMLELTLSEPQQLTVSSEAGSLLCNGDSTIVNVNATGGVAPYSGTGNFTVYAGTATFDVTDANGCSSTSIVEITQPEILKAKAEITDVDGTPMILVTATGGTYPYNGTGLFIPNIGENNFLIADSNNCTVAKSVFWQVGSGEQPLIVQASAGVIPCFGGETTVNVTASGGVGPYTGTGRFTVVAGRHVFTISDSEAHIDSIEVIIPEPEALSIASNVSAIACYGGTAEVSIAGSGGTAPYAGEGLFNLQAGNYEYRITDANGCTVATQIAVEQPQPLTASVSSSGILCFGESAEVSVTGEGGMAPYSGEGLFSLQAGTHSFSLVDANGCTATTQIEIAQPDSLKAIADAGAILCSGGSSTIAVSATGGSLPYSGTGQFNRTEGSYNFTVTDANGCESQVYVVVNEPAPLLVSSVLLSGGAQQQIEVAASGGVAPYTGTGIFVANEGENIFNVTDANGCSSSGSIVWENIAPLNVVANAGTINCSGETTTVIITASGGVSPYTGTGTFSVTAGTYNFTVTDSRNNETTVEVIVAEPALLTVSATYPAILCNGEKTTISVSAAGGVAPYYGTGSYSVKAGIYNYTIQDKNGCTVTTSVNVEQPDKLKVTRGPGNILCYGGTATIEIIASGGVAPYTGAGFYTLPAGTYNRKVTDANGCSVTASTTITQPDLLVATITAKTDVSCTGGRDGSIAVSGSGGKPGYMYSIDNEIFVRSNVFKLLAAGTYTVYIKDANGCIATATTTLADGTPNCRSNFGTQTQLTTKENEVLTDWIEVKAYPNPTLTEFKVSLKATEKEPVQLIVTDMYGQQVYQASGSGNATYTFGSDLPSGMYLLKVQQGKRQKSVKLIKGRG